MRLIAADEFKDVLLDYGHLDAASLLDDCPTAYDVEKVVEQLQRLDLDGIQMKEDGKHYLIRKSEAIKIVKTGGTNENR